MYVVLLLNPWIPDTEFPKPVNHTTSREWLAHQDPTLRKQNGAINWLQVANLFLCPSPQKSVALFHISHLPHQGTGPTHVFRGHQLTHRTNSLVHCSQWRPATWPRPSPLISLNIVFLCVPWGSVRFGLTGDNLSKMASMQEAHKKWWLLMNVAWQYGPFSFVFPVYLPSYSWKKHPFEDWPVCFFSLPDYLHAPLEKRVTCTVFLYPAALRKKVTFQVGSWGARGERENSLILSLHTDNCVKCFIFLTHIIVNTTLWDRYYYLHFKKKELRLETIKQLAWDIHVVKELSLDAPFSLSDSKAWALPGGFNTKEGANSWRA